MNAFLSLRALALLAGLGCALQGRAQIVNGDFETRTNVPSTLSNVGPSNPTYGFVDDLPSWDSPAATAGTYSYPATLISTDGTGGGQYSTTAPPPHSGISSVHIYEHDTYDHDYDQFIFQKLGQPLTPGHSYQFSFYALRVDHAPYRTKLALSVTTAEPFYENTNPSGSPGTLLPSPGSKVIVSDDNILPSMGWVQVTGVINIPCSETTNQWITIGYDRSNIQYDASLDTTFPTPSGIGYYLDDVSMADLGPTQPDEVDLIEHYQPVQCFENQEYYLINNFNKEYTYTFQRHGVTIIGNQSPTFRAKWSGGSSGGYFYITVSFTCNGVTTSTTSGPFGANSDGCDGGDPTTTRMAAAQVAYPNPASETIQLPEGVTSATVTDQYGKVILQTKGSRQVDVRDVPPGLYNLRMQRGDEVVNQHIQVQH